MEENDNSKSSKIHIDIEIICQSDHNVDSSRENNSANPQKEVQREWCFSEIAHTINVDLLDAV